MKSILIVMLIITITGIHGYSRFSIKEASIRDIQQAFTENKLTSRRLVEFYIQEIENLNHLLHAIIEVNPDVLHLADKADRERRRIFGFELHGIPVLVKDTISTKDKLNTTAGSFALLGSVVPRDAGTVRKLRRSGALILGKASLSEWAHVCSFSIPNGWSARGGQGKNPYVLPADPCGSSSGSAIAVAANMASVSLGTETDGSILCPASYNSVVGSNLQLDSPVVLEPICRTVTDAVYVLDAIVGFDSLDREATREATRFIPAGGYKQFLKKDGLKGKRLGIVRNPFFNFANGSNLYQVFEDHIDTLRRGGADIVDNLEIENVSVILNPMQSGEFTALLAEFKQSLNVYLKELIVSPEKMDVFDQDVLVMSESTSGMGKDQRDAVEKLEKLSRDGFMRMMMENKLDAMVSPGWSAASVLAIGGYPGISVPAGIPFCYFISKQNRTAAGIPFCYFI
ncbi:hypothetical protein MKW92_030936 [Papaver armeniacum]|nr:hypothetical protein MKW92_030936 [Papaver armeniacum]